MENVVDPGIETEKQPCCNGEAECAKPEACQSEVAGLEIPQAAVGEFADCTEETASTTGGEGSKTE